MTDHNKSETFEAVVERVGQPQWRLWDKRALIVLGLIILWTLVARIDRVVTAPAKVIPIDKVKVVQHLEGGIVKELVVREGQKVKAADPLIVLDLATVGVYGMELTTRMRLQCHREPRSPQSNLAASWGWLAVI